MKMIIDGHAHACGDFLIPENIIKKLDNSGVDKVVLVPGELDSSKNYWIPNIAEIFPSRNVVKVTNYLTKIIMKMTDAINQIPKGNEIVYYLSNKTNGRVIQFIWITQQIENPIEYLNERFIDWKFKGVKLHQCWDSFSIDSDFFRSIVEWSEKNDVPLFVHLYSDRDVKEIIKYKKKHPNLKLIIAHLFGIELFIKEDFKDDHLYFDSSTLQLTSTKRLMKTIRFVGAGNVMMGTDTPYGTENLRKNLERIRELNISPKGKDLILGENMKELLKI